MAQQQEKAGCFFILCPLTFLMLHAPYHRKPELRSSQAMHTKRLTSLSLLDTSKELKLKGKAR